MKNAVLLLLMYAASGCSPARADDTAFLQGLIKTAITAQQPRLTIPPGTYHIASPNGRGSNAGPVSSKQLRQQRLSRD